MTPEQKERLKAFFYHSNIPQEAMSNMEFLRRGYIDIALDVLTLVPESRVKDLALTYLEQSLTRAIQGLAHLGEAQDVT